MTTEVLPAPLEAPEPRRSMRSFVLLAGVLAWAGLLFFAAPGVGGTETKWPWQVWIASKQWFVRADLLLWAAAASAAIVVGVGLPRGDGVRARRALALLTVAACFLEIRVHAEAGAFPLMAEESRLDALKMFLPMEGLGVGLAVLASAEVRARRSAAALVVLSALALITMQISTFPKGIGGQSLASRTVTKGVELWREVVGGGEKLEEVRTQFVRLLLGRVAPFVSLVVAVVLAGFAAAGARRPPTRGLRIVAATALGFLVLRWVEPVALQFVLDARTIRTVGTTRVFRVLADALISAGLAGWLLASVAGAAWLRAAHAGDAPLPTAPLARRRVGGAGVAYAVGAALGVFALFAALNPEWGTFAKAWPWDVVRDLTWSQALSTLVFLVLFVAITTTSVASRPGPARGFFVATGAVLALVAVGGPNPTVERPEEFFFGVAPLLPPLLAALCAGGVLAGRHGGPAAARARAVAVGAGVCLLAILVWPLRVEPKRYGGGLEYRCILGVAASWSESLRDFFVGIEPGFGTPFVVFAHGALALLGISAGFRRIGLGRRVVAFAAAAIVWFWTPLAHRVLMAQPLENGQPSPWDQMLAQGANPWNPVLAYAGGFLLAFCVPFAIAIVGAMDDLAAPSLPAHVGGAPPLAPPD